MVGTVRPVKRICSRRRLGILFKKLIVSASVEERSTFASTIYASVLEYIHLRARASAANGERGGGGGRQANGGR